VSRGLPRLFWVAALAAVLLLFPAGRVSAQEAELPGVNITLSDTDDPTAVGTGVKFLLTLTVLSLAPAILVLMTSFTRIIVVLAFVRNALATQQMPPNQVLIGLALFLTFLIMSPVWNQVYQEVWVPFQEGALLPGEAFQRAMDPVRDFMMKHTREKDLALFLRFSDVESLGSPGDVPTQLLVPAFAISELKTAFQIGFLIFIPFVVIDMVVASTLMSMGMLMLPPMMISLPFKILLFVMVDGWHLLVKSLVQSFS